MAISSYYVGPNQPRLALPAWDTIEHAASAGLLDESHWAELKADVPSTSPGANLELARDLASLAIDGGLLVIGVEDAKGRAGVVAGVVDAGALADRIIQVSRSTVAPPLHVEVSRVPNGARDRDVLLVQVSASPLAPHMVDGRYWGRSAQGKTHLTDAEVERLYRSRRLDRDDFEARLRGLQAEAPVSANDQMHGHGQLLIRPLGAVTFPVGGRSERDDHLLQTIVAALHGSRPSWSPSVESLTYRVPHADGRMVASLAPDETQSGDERHLLRLLVADDGAISAFTGGITRDIKGQDGQEYECIPAGYAVELTHSLVMIAAHLASNELGYWGQWEAGVLFDGLGGVPPSQAFSASTNYGMHSYQQEEYVRATTTTTSEMIERPAEVVGRLLSGFLRGLNLDRRFLPYDTLADIGTRNRTGR